MDFNSKLKTFESMISGNGPSAPSKFNGQVPAKKPLVSAQDRLKLKEDDNRRQILHKQINVPSSSNDYDASPSDNYEHLLVNRYNFVLKIV